MPNLPHHLYTAEQVRRLDRIAIKEHGIPGKILMDRAGAVAFSVLRKRWPAAKKIAVFCGVGNNGGDGFVLARLAAEAGLEVNVFQVGEPDKIKGDALEAKTRLGKDVRYSDYSGQSLDAWDVLVDGLLGTGLKGEVGADWLRVIDAINQSGRPVLALDIPSGLHGDTGCMLGQAVRAAVTVTFIGLKQGLFTADGPACSGKVVFSNLQVPAEVYQGIHGACRRLHPKMLEDLLPPRRLTAHKGDFGHVLVVGGNHGMAGAARMAAEAAARVGAGLVSVASRPEHTGKYYVDRPEIMDHAVQQGSAMAPLLKKATVIAIGPGLGRDEWARDLLDTALASGKPLVVDADALNLLAEQPQRRSDWILTPHPGEAGRLLKKSNHEIQQDRFSAIRELQEHYGGVVALKGAGTMIVSEDLAISLCAEGNPGMASGGMGDVLTGVIAGLVAQGLSRENATQAGVYIHGLAADRAAREGERGMLASDLFPHIRHYANPVRR